MKPRAAAAALLCVAAAAGAEPHEQPPPQRIVSMNLCADELVLRLAAPGTVRSVTWLARDPSNSTVARQAQSVPVNHGLAEEIVPLEPDLVVAGVYTTRTTVALMKRLKAPVLELDVPNTLPDAMLQIQRVADALGRSDHGAALVESMKTAMTELVAEQRGAATGPAPRSEPPLAAVYRPNGFTVGAGSMVHDILTRAGLRNLAAERRIENYGLLPLDLLLLSQPDLLIMNSVDERPPALAYDVLKHPALKQEFGAARIVNMPAAWWTCAGPHLVDAIALLWRAGRSVGAVAGRGKQTVPR
ncbi:MAG: ABC transporter substrate-binding protein [Armatimonadota bacterium]